MRIWAQRRGTMRETKAIGIKHGIGKLGGRGHSMTMKYSDANWGWLEKNVDADAFTFYKSINL